MAESLLNGLKRVVRFWSFREIKPRVGTERSPLTSFTHTARDIVFDETT